MAEKLREPERGEKSELVRQLLADNPEGKNAELAAMFKDRMRQKGIKEDRDMSQIAQSFANEKTVMKQKAAKAAAETASDNSEGKKPAPAAKQARPAPASPTPEPAGTFTLEDLAAVEDLAKRTGGYENVAALAQFLAKKGK
jgi:hypothetical protein